MYSLLGENETSRMFYEQALQLDPEHFWAMIGLARLERQAGNQAQAMSWIEQARLLEGDAFYGRACLESVAGNIDAAIEALRMALEKRERSLEWAQQDPAFVFIRDDPRYRAMVGLDGD
jgi:tetratricopeptide (TPR) repeat protein